MRGQSSQQALITALRAPSRYPHAVRVVSLKETHISWVLLAGRYAYKIKKAVDLGFLNFTDLQARRFYCEEELRLNRRLAPRLYLDVISIGGVLEAPQLGTTPAIEYAVKMRRFATSQLMDRLMARGLVTPQHMDHMATLIAGFHAGLAPAAPDSAFGSLQDIHASAEQNFEQLASLLKADDTVQLASLRLACEREYIACKFLFEQRRQAGMVRECHGDLHLGNIALIQGEPVPFDGIEFNASLRWTDVMSEVAFLMMDVLHHQRTDLAFRLLNAYLEATGDYQGVGVLRFYLAYRATVRAKISAIRASQLEIKLSEAKRGMAACRRYLTLAANSLARRPPVLIIMHGLPGCGKTTVAQQVLEHLGAIRIRSDVERKRLFGLAPLQQSGSRVNDGIYSVDATQRTYAQLLKLARELLAAGFPVIVDAAFLKVAEREQFRALARELALPLVILSVKADDKVLRERIVQRLHHGQDASEADLAVLQKLQAFHEPILDAERAGVVEVINSTRQGARLGELLNHVAHLCKSLAA